MIGALMMGLGYAANAYGEHQGAQGLMDAKRQELQDQQMYDAQRQKLLGRYLDNLAPGVGQANAAMQTDDVMARNNAVQPAAAAGQRLLGVTARRPISAQSRAQTLGQSLGRRSDLDQTRRMTLGSDVEGVEHQREMMAYTYPELEMQGAKQGSEFRQLGSLLGAGGQAVNTYQQLQKQPRPIDYQYSNSPFVTDRLQGPSQYEGR